MLHYEFQKNNEAVQKGMLENWMISQRGAIIGECVGQVLGSKEQRQCNFQYFAELSLLISVYASKCGNNMRHINHSCDQNYGFVKITVNGILKLWVSTIKQTNIVNFLVFITKKIPNIYLSVNHLNVNCLLPTKRLIFETGNTLGEEPKNQILFFQVNVFSYNRKCSPVHLTQHARKVLVVDPNKDKGEYLGRKISFK